MGCGEIVEDAQSADMINVSSRQTSNELGYSDKSCSVLSSHSVVIHWRAGILVRNSKLDTDFQSKDITLNFAGLHGHLSGAHVDVCSTGSVTTAFLEHSDFPTREG